MSFVHFWKLLLIILSAEALVLWLLSSVVMIEWPTRLSQDTGAVPVDRFQRRGKEEFMEANPWNSSFPISEPTRKEYSINRNITQQAGIYGEYISKVLDDAAINSTEYGEEVDLRLLGPWEISPNYDEIGQRAGKDFDWSALANKNHSNNTEWIVRYADLLKPRLLQEPKNPATTFERPPDRQLRWDCASTPYMNGSRKSPLKIVDLLLFAYEFDILELRLYELDPVVDVFVILETSKSLKKWDKPLMLGSVINSPRFRRFRHKIIYYVLDDNSFSRYDKFMKLKLEQYEYVTVPVYEDVEPNGEADPKLYEDAELGLYEDVEPGLYEDADPGPYGDVEPDLYDRVDGGRRLKEIPAVVENSRGKYLGRGIKQGRIRRKKMRMGEIRRKKTEERYDLEEFARALVFEKYKEQFNDTMNDNVFLMHGDLDELPSAEQVAAFKYCQPEIDELPLSLPTRFVAQNFAWTRSDGVEVHDSPHVFNESSMIRNNDTGLLQPVRYPGAWVIDYPHIGAHMSSFMSPEGEVFKYLSYSDAGKLPRSDFDKHTAATLARYPEMGYVWNVCGVRTCTPRDPYLTSFINYDTWIPWFADANRERYPFLFPSSEVLQICEYVRDQQVDNREAFDRAISFAYSRGIRPRLLGSLYQVQPH